MYCDEVNRSSFVGTVVRGAALVLFMPLLASCFDLRSTTTTKQLDAAGVKRVVREWTGSSLPESISVVRASEVSGFMDPSMSAVFDAPSGGVDQFVAALGERRVREFTADCRDMSKPVAFTEVEEAMRVLDPKPQGEPSRIGGYQGGFESGSTLAESVTSGDLERCRNVVTVFAWPKGPRVDIAVQPKGGSTSRVALAVFYT